MRSIRWFSPPENLRERFLFCLGGKPYACWLDSNQNTEDAYAVYDFMAGAADEHAFICTEPLIWKNLRDKNLFGGLSYPLLQTSEPVSVQLRPALIEWPELFFFEPSVRIWKNTGSECVVIEAEHPEEIQRMLESCNPTEIRGSVRYAEEPVSGISPEAYKEKVEMLRNYIFEGDVYEANLSRNIFLKAEILYPEDLFSSWIQISPVPFSAYFKWKDRYVFSASPERFLAHRSGTLISQPIKGTAPRSQNPQEDQRNGIELQQSEKNRAENLMIVDLVRNDLNRSCVPGTVEVPELCGLHAFPWVYHLISTIQGQRRAQVSPQEAILHAFPPGSMTGAPKVRAMEIIHELEPEGRGLFAGSLGYMQAEGDFDFNVIIRSLIYHSERKILSYHAGGAVTIDSDAQEEYAETIAKSQGFLQWLNSVHRK